MNEKILFNCETFIEEIPKEELLSSIKDYFEELGYFNDINTDDEMNKFLANKYNIVFDDDNEVNEDSLKAVVIEILYSNNKKDNEILFNSINFDNDDEVDDISEEEDFDEDDDE